MIFNYYWNHLLVILFINIEPQSVHSQPQLCSFLILDVEVVDSVHLEILSNLQILHHGFLSVDKQGVSLAHQRDWLSSTNPKMVELWNPKAHGGLHSAWPWLPHRLNQTTLSSRWHVPGRYSTRIKTSLEKINTMRKKLLITHHLNILPYTSMTKASY